MNLDETKIVLETEASNNRKRGREEDPTTAVTEGVAVKRPSLFSNLVDAQNAQRKAKEEEGSSIFRDASGKCLIFDTKPETEFGKNSPSLFSKPSADAKSLFAPKAEGKSLFGGTTSTLFPPSNDSSTSLFPNGGSILPKTEEAKTEGGLFGAKGESSSIWGSTTKDLLFGTTPASSLFGKTPSNTASNIFGNTSTGLFNAKPAEKDPNDMPRSDDEPEMPVPEAKLEEEGFDLLFHDKNVSVLHKINVEQENGTKVAQFVSIGPGSVKILKPTDKEDTLLIFRAKGSGNIIINSACKDIIVGEKCLQMKNNLTGILLAVPCEPNEESDEKIKLYKIKFKDEENRLKLLKEHLDTKI